MAVPSDGSYGVRGGDHLLVPVPYANGEYDDRGGPRGPRLRRERIDATVKELTGEREAVEQLGLI